MSQQEFEPQGQPSNEEIDPLRYPYSWPDQPRQRGVPRDEPPGTSGEWSGQTGSQYEHLGPAPTRVQPRPWYNDSLVIAVAVTLGIFLVFLTVMLGLGNFFPVIGPYLLGVVWGAILALLVFAGLLIALVLRQIFRAIGQGKRHY